MGRLGEPSPRPQSVLRLTDSQLDQVLAAARPLDIHVRHDFLKHVASELAVCGDIGPGIVQRVCAPAQREFFNPPNFGTGTWAKYRG
jgi:hypothetical protein